MQAIVFFVGQVIINNVDILLVKHFFPSVMAGLYAAIALVGRVVYMLSWSVVSAMFPISAGATRDTTTARCWWCRCSLSWRSPFCLAGAGVVSALGPALCFRRRLQCAARGLESLLSLYAIATGVYSLSVVLMTYEMSRKLANSGYVQLFFSGALVLGICLFHSSLRQVILVQLVLMVLLLLMAALPSLGTQTARGPLAGVAAEPVVTRRRRVTEAEVIAHFLRNEFHHAEFDADRERFRPVVLQADITNQTENALRRALLFRRRGTMWRELPPGHRMVGELGSRENAIEQLRVSPRSGASWLPAVTCCATSWPAFTVAIFTGRTEAFMGRIRRLSEYLAAHANDSSVLLIGINERQPLTILEGNHRVTAAMLSHPGLVRQRSRFYCGFSPHMTECCWYLTSLATLYRYARNRLKILSYDREADIAKFLTLHPPRGRMDPIVPAEGETSARQAS